MLSKSRFQRRLDAISEDYWQDLLHMMSQLVENPSGAYAVDSFPILVCHNIRIKRCRIYTEEKYRGYCASKRQYFYGLRIHAVLSTSGQTVEFSLAPASEHDCKVFKRLNLDLPEESSLYADAAYTDYEYEDLLNEHMHFSPLRKSNSKRPVSMSTRYIQGKLRKGVETAGSLIQRLLPAKIHAVTPRGFERKVALFVIGAAFLNFFKHCPLYAS